MHDGLMDLRRYTWAGVDDPARLDHAIVEFPVAGFRAIGTSTAIDYTTTWALDVDSAWRTRALQVSAHGFGWSRRLELSRAANGTWTATAHSRGESDLPAPGLDETVDLDGAVDCDLGLCPVTNVMPIRRLGLLEHEVEDTPLVMAWVEVPSLRVLRSDQIYGSVDIAEGRRVRYTSASRDFSATLTVDDVGVVLEYPGLAHRL
jgi:hypothetical protein